jgi:hypothetical protein
MITKSSVPEERASPQSSGKHPVCWSKDPQAHSLRVELIDGSSFIFPYSNFEFASFEGQDQQEILNIAFATHTLRVAGRNLREIALALQKVSVDVLRELSNKYASIWSKDSAFIESIEVLRIGKVDTSKPQPSS